MTIEDLERRHSVRSFTTEPLSEKEIRAIQAEITYINCGDSRMHFALCTNDSMPFKGFFKSYGFFKNPNNYIAAIVDPPVTARGVDDATIIAAGYYGEQLAMKAVDLGLGTCFVGGTYDSASVGVNLKVGQKLLFLIIIGHEDLQSSPTAMARISKIFIPNKRNYLSFLCLDNTDKSKSQYILENEWMVNGLRAVAAAPSALNRQPVRVHVSFPDNKLTLEVPFDSKHRNLLDLGIALFNFQAVCGGGFEETNPSVYTI